MKKFAKILCGVALSFVCLFTCVGYAQMSRSLIIDGSLTATPPEKLFITGVTPGDIGVFSDQPYFAGTLVTSNISLEDNGNGTYSAQYKVTFWNNTTQTYYYLAMVRGTYEDENGTLVSYSNENIEMSLDIKLGDEISPGATKTVTVTASFKKGADTTDKTLSSIIDYQFGLEKPENNDQAAISGLLSRFPDILNDPEDYATLTTALDKNTTHPDYIGNVVGFWGINNDIAAVEELFGVALELNVDGENVPVTVIIQRNNVDGNEKTGDTYSYEQRDWWGNTTTITKNGNEMILFMTPDDLESVSGGQYVEVYAIVYTRDEGGTEWYQIGEMYRGSAQAVGYVLGTTLTHDSFNPNTWRELDANGNRTNITLAQALANSKANQTQNGS